MMTNITELAQREKSEAWARSQKLSIAYGDCGYVYSSTEMAWRAVKALSAELVEALEKANQVDEELCKLLPPGAEYMDPPDGGDVTPLEGVRRIVADYRQRIAELESRTVKLPKKNIGWDRDEDDCWNNAIDACTEALTAAGIKVEAE